MTAAVPAPPASGPRRWARRVVILLAVLAALAAAAWWGVPALLVAQVPVQLGKALGRPVSLDSARFDPLQMTVELQGLRIGAATGSTGAEPLLDIRQIQADLALGQTLRHRAPVIEALTIDGLRARLTRTADGHYDIDDLITRFGAPSAAPADAEPARFALHNLALRDAELRFDDRPVARVHAVQALTLTLPFLSNLPSDVEIRTEPRLAFRLNGTPFDTGAQSLPFAATRRGDLQLAFDGLDLAPWLPYLPASLPMRVQRGKLDSQLGLHFSLPPTAQAGRPEVAVKGRIALRDLALAEPDGAPLAAWQALTLELRDVQPLARRVALGPLAVDGLVLDLRRDAQGRLNLQRLAGATASSPASASATPAASAASAAAPAAADAWALSLDGLRLNGAQLRWQDASLKPAAGFTLTDVALTTQALRWPEPPPVPVALKATLHSGGADGPTAATIDINGTASDQQATLTLALDAPDLGLFAPYLAGALKPRLAGQLGLKAQLNWAAEPAALSLAMDEATLRDLQLRDGSGRGATLLAGVKRLQASGVALNLQTRQATIGRLQIDKPQAAVMRKADGQLDLAAWLPAAPAGSGKSASPAPATAPAASDWQLRLQDLQLQGGRISLTDAAAATAGAPLRADLSALKLQLQGFAWPAGADRRAPLPRLQVSASIGAAAPPGAPADRAPERGQIDWNGRVGLAPLMAEGKLTLARLPLHLFTAYAGDALPAQLLHADASLALQLRAASTPAGWTVRSDGDLQLTEVMVHTRPTPGERVGNELLSWQTLALQGVSATIAPPAKPRVVVQQLALDDFFSRLVITEQGRFNLQDVAAAPADAASAPASAASAPAVVAAAPASAAPASGGAAATGAGLPIDLELGQTTLRNGRVDFSDRFIRPNYSARLTELNGSIGTIRSGTREMATISLRGRAADTALLDISGQLNPTAQPLALDIRARATDLELAPLSPYAGKYAGYAIERGKLSMDVSYKIDADGKLDAKNQVILNQLTFGEKVDSPSATQLPVLLAVALLKDRNGVIDINLPVSGTLSDPQFSVGAIVWKVIVNLLTKALTAPFALLSGGGADDLSQVQFAPGTARVTDAGRQALDKVAKALVDRPSLMMTVTGAADTVSERGEARRSLLDERIAAEARRERQRAAPAAAQPASGASAPAAPPLTAAEHATALKRLYQQTPLPDRPRNLINQLKDIPPAEMEQRLLAGITITDDTMRELALQRGLAVRDALIAQGLPSERLFLAAPKLRLSGEGDAAWVPSVNLTLSTR